MDDQAPDDEIARAELLDAALKHVTTAHRDVETATQNRLDMIDAARELGASWTAIGKAMEMSRQVAHKRFGDHRPR